MEARITDTQKYFLIAAAIIAFGVFSRFVPHLDNFVPITALSLLAAVYLPRKMALLVPLGIMVASDLFIGLHNTVLFTWGSFVLIALIGSIIYGKTHKQYPVVLFSPVAAVLFFVITNFGVWLVSGMYSHTWAGLVSCYTLALPFFRATLMSDMIFTSIIFGAVALLVKITTLAVNRYKSISVN